MAPVLTMEGKVATYNAPEGNWFERAVGCFGVSIFTTCYYYSTAYLIFVCYTAVTYGVSSPFFMGSCLPALLSAMLPGLPVKLSQWILSLWLFKCIPKYFRFSAILETSDEKVREMEKGGQRVIYACQPHGVLSVVGLALAASLAPQPNFPPTAVASVLLRVPILKHVMGLFYLIDASSKSLTKCLTVKKESIVLYVGGMAELFLSSPDEERLFIRQRKGFIKLALRTGSDVIPCYFFGNTSALEVARGDFLAMLSRRLGVSITLTWGRWGLPIPKPKKLLAVRGKPLGMPSAPNPDPSQADIDKWHSLYCDQVVRLFDQYKGLVPDYAEKELILEEPKEDKKEA